MRHFRLFVATLWLLTLGLAAAPARAAGSFSVANPIWTHRVADRLSNLLNRRDCTDDAIATFHVTFNSVLAGAFEVWSGTGCDQATNRSAASTTKTCVRVSAPTMSPITQDVQIHFRDMVATPGADPTGGIEECDAPQSIGLQTRTVYFIVYDMNTLASLATGTNAAWAFKYDISAPPPPTNVTAESGDGSIVTSFTPPTGETNLLHYHFYCSPQVVPTATSGGTAGTAGTDTGGTTATDTGGSGVGGAGADTGGTSGTAGTDTGGTSGTAGTDTGGTSGTAGTSGSSGTAGTSATLDPTCGSDILVPGQAPPAGAIDCGTIGAQGAKGGETTPVLGNDSGYAVAIATEDTTNNIGVLSGLACATPKDIRGFYEAYRQAGGQAGGGYCSFAPARGAAAGALGFMLAVGALLVRRRR